MWDDVGVCANKWDDVGMKWEYVGMKWELSGNMWEYVGMCGNEVATE